MGEELTTREDLTGRRFGRLVVVGLAGVDRWGKPRFTVRCDCPAATVKVVLRNSLTSGRTQSCGCFQKEGMRKRFTKHGMYQAKEYQLWGEMIQRCTNPNNIGWKYYGGQGITVCDRWRHGDDGLSGFECFLLDVGFRPGPEYSMERFPDKHGPYVKSNFRWATPRQPR
jgi:hypothetical protein